MIQILAHGCEAKAIWQIRSRLCFPWRAGRPGWRESALNFQSKLFAFPLQQPSISKKYFHFSDSERLEGVELLHSSHPCVFQVSYVGEALPHAGLLHN